MKNNKQMMDPYQTYMSKSNSRSLLESKSVELDKEQQMMQLQDQQAFQNRLALGAQGLNSIAPGNPVAPVASTAATGAMLAGPGNAAIGAGIGAGVGLVGALAQQRAARKQRQRDAQAGMYKREAEIIQATNQDQQNTVTNMLTALRAAFDLSKPRA